MNARTNSHITSNAKRNARGAAPLLAALLAALALGACGRQDDGMTAGQKVDQSVAQAEQKSAEASAQIKEAGRDVAEAAKDVGNKVVTSDAAITTTVNAELAKDQKLSALKINVDTVQGRVELRGTAPDAESKDRATRIAATVKGVSSVENLLTVEAKS